MTSVQGTNRDEVTGMDGMPVAQYPGMTIEMFIGAQRADGYSANTIRARVNCVRAIAKHAGVSPQELQSVHVLGYFSTRALTNWTRRTYLNHLSAFGRWLGVNLVEGIRKPPAPRSVPDPLSESDLAALLAQATDPRHIPWALLGAYCGLRAHETAKLAVEDFQDVGGREVVLRVLGKGGRTDILPVPPVVLAALNRSGSGRLWPGLRPELVSRSISKLAATAGVRMRYHQLRHRFGTAVYRASGNDLLVTQRLMRHSSPATTAGYAAVADDRIHRIAWALPGALVARAEEALTHAA